MRANIVPLAELLAAFVYDETSKSCLRLRVNKYRGRKHTTLVHRAGDEVGCLHKANGYYVTSHNGTHLMCHRVVYSIVNGVELGADEEVDHEDGDRGNNKEANLRRVEPTVNAKNKAMYASNTTGVTGVYLNRSRGGRSYYVASVGNELKRYFPVHSMGAGAALEAAVAFRAEQLALSPEYTERHGT